MSEYEYYEFQAVDRPLSTDEMRALRAISSRATITPTRFSNFYTFGSLKANPHDLLARYFDVFVYLANWRYRELAFRFPTGVLEAKTARLYVLPNGLRVRAQGTSTLVIASVESPDDAIESDDDDGSGWLSTLAGLRADLAAGDHRVLYLAWLTGVQAGEVDDDAVEPQCPPGLSDLSGSLEAFVDFVWLDPDLVAAAAEGSQPLKETSDVDVQQWIASLSNAEKTQLLVRVVRRDGAVAAELASRFRRATKAILPPIRGRRVSELRASAERRADERRRAEREQAADALRKRKAEEQQVRIEYLDALARRQDATWREVEQLIGSHKPTSYIRATTLLVDLRDVAERGGRPDAFVRQLAALRARHAAKPAFQSRLRVAGLGEDSQARR